MNANKPRVIYNFTRDLKPEYSVIAARHQDKWIFVRHRERGTWEIPGGHIEPGETPLQAAERELFEETGADSFIIREIGPYGVARGALESHGMLFFSQISHLGLLPPVSEMAELICSDNMPDRLTYPEIQPVLHSQASKWFFENITTIYFIRHAQPDYSVKSDASRPLTHDGFAAAEKLAEKLRGVQFDGIYSSPYKRAADTVKPLADINGLDVIFEERFKERRIDGEVWIEDFEAFSRRQWEDLDFRLENGESLRQVQSRNVEALNMVLSAKKGKIIAIGTHGTALSMILRYFDDSFDYDNFGYIKDVMPYVVKMEFIDGKPISKVEII